MRIPADFGWDGIITILVSVARTRLDKLSQGTVGPTSSQEEEVERARDASKSMSYLSPPYRQKGKE
jgi:hypothetical protein